MVLNMIQYPHYGFAFNNVRNNQPNAQNELNIVINNHNINNIVLGTAIRYQDYNNNPLAFENLKMALTSSSPMVRRAGLESLRALPIEQQFKWALPLAKDSVNGVRHIANSLIYDMPIANLPVDKQQIVNKARKEYINQLLYWQDRSIGLSSLGAATVGLGKPNQAEKYYKKAIIVDSLDVIAQVNYADLKRMQGKNEECIQILKNVLKINNKFSAAYQALAFAYIRTGDKKKALKTFEVAKNKVAIDPQNYYYYAIILND